MAVAKEWSNLLFMTLQKSEWNFPFSYENEFLCYIYLYLVNKIQGNEYFYNKQCFGNKNTDLLGTLIYINK